MIEMRSTNIKWYTNVSNIDLAATTTRATTRATKSAPATSEVAALRRAGKTRFCLSVLGND